MVLEPSSYIHSGIKLEIMKCLVSMTKENAYINLDGHIIDQEYAST